ncbi:hypothetical protein COX24_02700 [bacterium (Candidatus Gribaldobacteria) CG23_combo_of_CG06-09_8_20_14_all_37_87_8]|uniref:Guanylate kinase-like domain-containing protein n=1 Tax=bacterium (Candidatus Gribaldobacteria) CG23_combo_of_CG06-09_8_20_14_all_37_87_8 TaxID=2014278 RepID=A0A2G9ZER2_9BACT|nr:MAG: hypothetical protein COX24_02700 [bacterium (Candidatus Gribaldobacteria) CG23_combo_of_CG06-09_8_20_14_all_37_87_8]
MRNERNYPWGQNQKVENIDYSNIPEKLLQRDYQIVLIAGPNAVGKGTIIEKLLESSEEFVRVVRTTTKPISELEKGGYYTVSKETFWEMIDDGDFLEWSNYGQGHYGTRMQDIANSLEKGKRVLIEIDLDGALVLRNFFKNLGINVYDCFISPITREETMSEGGMNKALDVIKERLKIRGRNESEIEVEGRVRNAERMLSRMNEFRYVIPNIQGNTKQAVKTIMQLLGA